jgi:hypothetical protein
MEICSHKWQDKDQITQQILSLNKIIATFKCDGLRLYDVYCYNYEKEKAVTPNPHEDQAVTRNPQVPFFQVILQLFFEKLYTRKAIYISDVPEMKF